MPNRDPGPTEAMAGTGGARRRREEAHEDG